MRTERTTWPIAMPQASQRRLVLGDPVTAVLGTRPEKPNGKRSRPERRHNRGRLVGRRPSDIEAESGRIVCMIGHSASSQASERIAYKSEGIRLGAFTDAVIALAAACNVDVRFHPLAEY